MTQCQYILVGTIYNSSYTSDCGIFSLFTLCCFRFKVSYDNLGVVEPGGIRSRENELVIGDRDYSVVWYDDTSFFVVIGVCILSYEVPSLCILLRSSGTIRTLESAGH